MELHSGLANRDTSTLLRVNFVKRITVLTSSEFKLNRKTVEFPPKHHQRCSEASEFCLELHGLQVSNETAVGTLWFRGEGLTVVSGRTLTFLPQEAGMLSCGISSLKRFFQHTPCVMEHFEGHWEVIFEFVGAGHFPWWG